MIQSVHLRNFKCFRDQIVRFSPLTLLTGFNAAGKSSFLHGPLLVAQALRDGGRSHRVPLNGKLVSLGTPGDVFCDDGGATAEVQIQFDGTSVSWQMGPGKDRNSHTVELEKIVWEAKGRDEVWRSGSGVLTDYSIPGEVPTAANSDLRALSEAVFISAVRDGATDIFAGPDEADPVWADVGARGDLAAWWFANHIDEDVVAERQHRSESAPSLRRQFNAWISELFPGVEANAQRVPGTDMVRLEFKNHAADSWRRPANIGYGISYVFPIMVSGLLAKAGQVLVIDSPEAHLHPHAQSQMGGFLAHLANSGVQVLVETHSDHLLNGVRLAAKNGVLEPKNVAIQFFNQRQKDDSGLPHVVTIQIDKNGNLSDWPGGFFDQSERDLAALVGWGDDLDGAS